MNTYFRYSLLILFVLVAFTTSMVSGQTGRVLVTNSVGSPTSPGITIKWYSDKLWYKEGVKIYRLTSGAEQELVAAIRKVRFDTAIHTTMTRQEYDDFLLTKDSAKIAEKFSMMGIPLSVLRTDRDLLGFIGMVEGSQKIDSVFYLATLIKSFQSMWFSRYLGITCHDNKVVAGQKYQYIVREIVNGKERELGRSNVIEAGKITKESPPKEISILNRVDSVFFKWRYESDRFYGVNIYRSKEGENEAKKINRLPVMTFKPATGTIRYSFAEGGLAPGNYNYQLAAVDFFNQESSLSESFVVRIVDKKSNSINSLTNGVDAKKTDNRLDTVAPMKVQGLKTTSSQGKIQITWSRNTEKDLKGYWIYRALEGETKNFSLMQAPLITQTIFEDEIPENVSNKFVYQVVAVDTALNQGPPSEISMAIRMPDATGPDQPYIHTIKVLENGLQVEWLPNEDEDLKGYQLYRQSSKSNQLPPKILNKTLLFPAEKSFLDLDVENEDEYLYSLEAIDLAGNVSERSIPFSIYYGKTKPIDITFTRTRFKRSSREIEIAWKVNLDQDIVGFVIYSLDETSQNDLMPITGILTKNEFKTKLLENVKSVSYQVRCFFKNGKIEKSAVVKIDTPL